MSSHAQRRTRDYGFRISDFGTEIAIRNPQSVLRTPYSLLPISGMLGRVTLICALAAAVICTLPQQIAAQPSPLHEAFEEVERESAPAENSGTVRQPFAEDAEQELPDTSSDRDFRGTAPTSESLPPPRFEGRVPMAGSLPSQDIHMSQNADGLIQLQVRDQPLSRVLALLAQTQGLNIVASNDIDALISITLTDVPLEEALTAILSVANYTWVERNNIILITSLTDAANLSAGVQGRQIQVFELDFVSASKVAEVVAGFLSPIGKVSHSASDPANNRLTRELVVVEDLPDSLARVAAYIAQVDSPPRQVLIEAHVLQVTLDDTNSQGVDFAALFSVAGANVDLISTPSLGVPAANLFDPSQPVSSALVAAVSATDLNAVIQLLQTTTDAKTLGSPKLLVLNEQEARLQVGEKIGFKVTTTTETSSLESVQFLEVGTILRIIPRITRDGRVLLHVAPEVSTGELGAAGVPNSKTTELDTDVMLRDGQGMIIGGLITESDSVTQSKIPYLGDVKGLGWFFRRSEVIKQRVEIIVALVPRIQPYHPEWHEFEQGELARAGTPLFHGPLCRTHRPWEPILADGDRVHKPLIPRDLSRHLLPGRQARPHYGPGSEYYVPPHPLPRQQFYGEYCDPALQGPATLRPQRHFLSDEAMPAPQAGHESWNRAEIITDQ